MMKEVIIPMRTVSIAAALLIAASAAVASNVGDYRPALANYTINNNAGNGYHGPWLDISSYNGKGIVVVHWKRS